MATPDVALEVTGLAKRFPKTKIILDHLARPEIDDGAPYNKAVSLFAMANFDNIYLKMTPRIFVDLSATRDIDASET